MKRDDPLDLYPKPKPTPAEKLRERAELFGDLGKADLPPPMLPTGDHKSHKSHT